MLVVNHADIKDGSTLTVDSLGSMDIKSGASISFGDNTSLTVKGNLTIGSEAILNNIANITVPSGGVLTDNSGVILKFNSASDVYDEGAPKGALGIGGKIHADGATFTSNSTDADNYWAAMYI